MSEQLTSSSLTSEFLASLKAGRVCVHPTDTLPGLTFDPSLGDARDALVRLKGRPEDKPCLGLVASLAKAKEFFAPLPPGWDDALARLWPGPLSIVWEASAAAPAALIAKDGTIGLRVPALAASAAWFQAVLEAAALPLPTTSINRAGEPAMTQLEQVRMTWPDRADLYAPDFSVIKDRDGALPSTVIRLRADGSFEVLRRGALAVDRIFDEMIVARGSLA